MQTLSLNTSNPQQFLDITHDISQIVQNSNVKDGEVLVYCPHTTAGITINESADPDVVKDIISTLEKVIPTGRNYRHMEGNSHAHIKSSLMGCSQRIIIYDGRLLLGTWQGIFFCEFDGPRSRKVHVKVIGE